MAEPADKHELPEQAPVEAMDVLLSKRVAQYVMIRDHLKEMDELHEKKRKPLVEVQNLLVGYMEQFMAQTGATSVKTTGGTFYKSVRYTASLEDPDAFMNYVKATGNLDLLDRRANTTAVKDFIKQHGVKPPGVNFSAMSTVGVKRPAGSKKEE